MNDMRKLLNLMEGLFTNKVTENSLSEDKQDKLIADLKKRFGFDARRGDGWDKSALVWSGEDAYMPDGSPAFNYDSWETDPQEKRYIMGVHRDLAAWADKHGLHWEANDPGTYLLYDSIQDNKPVIEQEDEDDDNPEEKLPELNDGDIVEFTRDSPYKRNGYFRVSLDALGAKPTKPWIGDLKNDEGWYVESDNLHVVLSSDDYNTNSIRSEEDLQDALSDVGTEIEEQEEIKEDDHDIYNSSQTFEDETGEEYSCIQIANNFKEAMIAQGDVENAIYAAKSYMFFPAKFIVKCFVHVYHESPSQWLINNLGESVEEAWTPQVHKGKDGKWNVYSSGEVIAGPFDNEDEADMAANSSEEIDEGLNYHSLEQLLSGYVGRISAAFIASSLASMEGPFNTENVKKIVKNNVSDENLTNKIVSDIFKTMETVEETSGSNINWTYHSLHQLANDIFSYEKERNNVNPSEKLWCTSLLTSNGKNYVATISQVDENTGKIVGRLGTYEISVGPSGNLIDIINDNTSHTGREIARYQPKGDFYFDADGNEINEQIKEKIDNPDYIYYVLHTGENKIESGWEYKEDAIEQIRDNLNNDKKTFKVAALVTLKKLGLDPEDDRNWLISNR